MSSDVVIRRSRQPMSATPASRTTYNFSEKELRDIVREQFDRDSLQSLAEFLRTTGPPHLDEPELRSDCLGFPASTEHRRWSVQALRKGRRSETRATSLQIQLPSNAIPGKTSSGHPYVAISIPAAIIDDEARLDTRPRSHTRRSSVVSRLRIEEPAWPERNSSKAMLSPTSVERNSSRPSSTAESGREPRDSVRLSVRALASNNGVGAYLRLVDEDFETDSASERNSQRSSREIRRADSTSKRRKESLHQLELTDESIRIRPSTSSMAEEEFDHDDEDWTLPIQPLPVQLIPTLNLPDIDAEAPPSPLPELVFADNMDSPRPRPVTIAEAREQRPRLEAVLSHMSDPGTSNPSLKGPGRTLKKPADIVVRPKGLVVPKETMQPDSPGFPNMLAAMTFPSPPRSSSPRAVVVTSPTSIHSPSSAQIEFHDSVGDKVSKPGSRDSFPDVKTDRSQSIDSSATGEYESRRESTASHSTRTSGAYRHSASSATTAESESKTVTEEHNRNHSFDSVESSTHGSIRRIDALEARTTESERAGSPSSLNSNSSTATTKSLADRRLARRVKVREVRQRDLEHARSNGKSLKPPAADNFDLVDSPVLGYFPHHQQSRARPSPLAGSPTTLSSLEPLRKPAEKTSSSSYPAALSINVPETVPEATSPVTPKSQGWTLSPVMVNDTAPGFPRGPPSSKNDDDVSDCGSDDGPLLTLSPLMIVANVGSAGGTKLRPLSLLTPESVQAPALPMRSSLRAQPKRPIPIKILPRSSRYSFSNMPTPPLSPDIFANKRNSLPAQAAAQTQTQLARSHSVSPNSPSRLQETKWLVAHQKETAQEWRIAAIKRRMQKELLEKKDQSISPSDELELATTMRRQDHDSSEIEDRLQRLEKSGDAWLTIMIPILENMNRTLTELQRNGTEPAKLGQYLAGHAEAVRATWSQLSTSPVSEEKEASSVARPPSLPVEVERRRDARGGISRTRSVEQLRRCYEADVEPISSV